MAINILDEDIYTKCPKCGCQYFKEEEIFMIKNYNSRNIDKIEKSDFRIVTKCSNCGFTLKGRQR